MVWVVSALRLHEEEVWAMAAGLEAPDMRDAADCKVEGRKSKSFAASILGPRSESKAACASLCDYHVLA